MKAPKDPRGYKHSDIYLYNLEKMSEEAVAKYGLTKAYERYEASKEVDDVK